jgi:hypothetical protein
MTEEERNELSALKYKEASGTITPSEAVTLEDLRETYSCE